MEKVEGDCKAQQKYSFIGLVCESLAIIDIFYIIYGYKCSLLDLHVCSFEEEIVIMKIGTALQQIFVLLSSHQGEFVWLTVEISYCSFSFFSV